MSSQIQLVFEKPILTLYGIWHEYLFKYIDYDVIVMAYGKWNQVQHPLVRINSSCVSAQSLASIECDCREQLEIAYQRIAKSGSGLIVHLDQDGRGNGHHAMMRAAVFAKENACTQGEAYESLGYSSDARTFEGAGCALKFLNIDSVTLMTNNPQKIQALVDVGIEVKKSKILATTANTDLRNYYLLKAKEGHDTDINDLSLEFEK